MSTDFSPPEDLFGENETSPSASAPQNNNQGRTLLLRFISGLFLFFVVVAAAIIGFFTVASLTDNWTEAGIFIKLLIFVGAFVIGVFVPVVAALWMRKQLLKTSISGPWRRTLLYITAAAVQIGFVSTIFYISSKQPADVSFKAQEIVKEEFGEVPVVSSTLDKATALLTENETHVVTEQNQPKKTEPTGNAPAEVEVLEKEEGQLESDPESVPTQDAPVQEKEEDQVESGREPMPTPAQLAKDEGTETIEGALENAREQDRDDEHENLGDANIVSPTIKTTDSEFILSYTDLEGQPQQKAYDISSLRYEGKLSERFHMAATGNVITIIGGRTPLAFLPDLDDPVAIPALKVGSTITDFGTILQLHQVFIASTGAVVAEVTLADDSNKAKKAIVLSNVETPNQASISRVTGMDIPGRNLAQSTDITINDVSEHGRVVLRESFELGVKNKTQGRYQQRLLSGVIDNMKHMVEKASTETRLSFGAQVYDMSKFLSVVIDDEGFIFFEAELTTKGQQSFSISPLGDIEVVNPGE